MKPLSVLVIDPEPTFREQLRLFVRGRPEVGAVYAVPTADEALQHAAQAPPDVILADLLVPLRHGLAMISTLRQRFPATPLIVLSIHDEPVYRRAATEAGAAVFIHKMLTAEALPAALRAVTQTLDEQAR